MIDILKALQDDDLRGDWEQILVLLSLDATRPFWGDLRIQLKDPDAVFAAMRRFVEAQNNLAMDGDDNYAEEVRWLSWRLLGDIGLVEGEETVHVLWNWFETAGRPEAKWHWMWRILLYLFDGVSAGELLGRGVPRAKAEKLLRISADWSDLVDELQGRLEKAEVLPKSKWDKLQDTMFQLETETDYEVFGGLQEALERPHFDRFWARVVDLLSPKEMESLVRWGKARYALIESPKDKEKLGDLALQANDALVPPELRTRN
jgi:hypothetical protein